MLICKKYCTYTNGVLIKPYLLYVLWAGIPSFKRKSLKAVFFWSRLTTANEGTRGPFSVVGIATGYGLDGPGIESWWGRDFPHLSRPALGPPSLLYSGYRDFPGGKEQPGRDADPSPPSSAVVKKE